MEIFSFAFLSALASIIVIDLVLAGDNAIVIALASRKLPAHLQRRAILWGTAGAIVARSALTLAVVWLLQIPGLMLIGGVLLVVIAYRLLLPEDDKQEGGDDVQNYGVLAAIQTIVVADIVMGLDNVLAVAGAAHGSYLLVIIGLLISIPIVVWGSTIMLRWIERYPAIVYIGAAVLALTAAKMIVSEPYVKDFFAAHRAVEILLFLGVIGGVLWGGFVKNHRQIESRISSRLAAQNRDQATDGADGATQTEGKPAKLKVLVPVDGSPNSAFAVRHVASELKKNGDLEMHLLNVQSPLSRHIGGFLSRKTRDEYHHDEAQKALKPAEALVKELGVPYTTHFCVGNDADMIIDEAKRLQCDRIVMSTARKNSFTRMLQDSTTNNVLEQSTVPVLVIAGEAVSKLERIGVPAAICAVVALVAFAILG